MKINAKLVAGIFLACSGIYAIADMSEGVYSVITAVILFGIAFLLIGNSQKEKPVRSNVEEVSPIEPETVTHKITIKINGNNNSGKEPHRFKVAGVEHYLDNIMELGIENYEFEEKLSDLTQDKFEDFKVFEYEFYGHDATLEPEPDNPYDPNAIKVMIDGLLVGYIYKCDCAKVKKLLSQKGATIDCFIGGGKRRNFILKLNNTYDIENEVTWEEETTETDYFVNITIYTPITGGGNEEE